MNTCCKPRLENAVEIEQLRCTLFDAVLQGDQRRLEALYTNHRQAIVTNFQDWRRVPEAIRNDAEAMHAWASVLLIVAQHLDSLGVPDPMAWLTDSTRLNPIREYYHTFERAQLLGEASRFDEAYEILLELLCDLEGAQGQLSRDLRPKVLGLLGSNRFGARDLAASIDWTSRALSECQRLGDGDGVRVYRGSLQILNVLQLLHVDRAAGEHLLRCRRVIVKAQDLSDRGHYQRSNNLLQEALHLIGDDDHSPLREYRAKVLGQLGWNYFHLQDKASAQARTEQALEVCRATGDEDGIRIYTVNLATIEKV